MEGCKAAASCHVLFQTSQNFSGTFVTGHHAHGMEPGNSAKTCGKDPP